MLKTWAADMSQLATACDGSWTPGLWVDTWAWLAPLGPAEAAAAAAGALLAPFAAFSRTVSHALCTLHAGLQQS